MKAAVYYAPGDIRVEDRPEPVPTADNLIVKIHCCAICGTDLKLASDALQMLLEYEWPGNVRELENVIERAAVLVDGESIDTNLIPDHVRSGQTFRVPQVVVPEEGISFRDVITDFEKKLIESSLETSGGVQKRAAQLLGLKPTTLNEMIKRYNIQLERKESTG